MAKRNSTNTAQLDLADIKRIAVIAMFSDDVLMQQLVFKGGGALNQVYKIDARGSIDLDFSMQHSFADIEDAKRRTFQALRDRFDAVGYSVFDERFEQRPSVITPDRKDWWGGYSVEFKLIAKEKFSRLQSDPGALSRSAHVVGPEQRRKFQIDISQHEFCAQKVRATLDEYTIYVYTLEMIAIEKIRAICQQMPEYEPVGNKRPRARDFYDVCQILDAKGIELADGANLELFRLIFEAKRVPLSLLPKIRQTREFHRLDWPSVETTVSGKLDGFDHYFDRVVGEVERLQALWEE